jgi:hypothetical protein
VEVKVEEEATQAGGWSGDLQDLIALQQGVGRRRSKRRRMSQLPATAAAIMAEVAAGVTSADEAVGGVGVLAAGDPQQQQQQQHSISQLPKRPARGTIGSVELFKAPSAVDAAPPKAAAPPAQQLAAAQLWQAAAQQVGQVVSCSNLQALAEAASLFGEASLSHGLK